MAGSTVFQSFPMAIVEGVWKLGQVSKGTIRGNVYTEADDFADVIVIDDFQQKNASGLVPGLEKKAVLYAKPEQMPTQDLEAFISDYLWHNTKTDKFYAIELAQAGMNQETGVLEHIEFTLKPSSVSYTEV